MTRQTQIPGTEQKTPAAVRAAGEAYVTEASKQAKQQRKTKEAKEVLVAAMQKHEVESFRDDEVSPPVIVSLTERAGIKVTKLKKADGEEGEDADAESAA
jgi:hypothetical protein